MILFNLLFQPCVSQAAFSSLWDPRLYLVNNNKKNFTEKRWKLFNAFFFSSFLSIIFPLNLLSTPNFFPFNQLLIDTAMECVGTKNLSYLNQDYNVTPKLYSCNPGVWMLLDFFTIKISAFTICQVFNPLIWHNFSFSFEY